jgi:sporulation protein YlmC with PRC-barrel domain
MYEGDQRPRSGVAEPLPTAVVEVADARPAITRGKATPLPASEETQMMMIKHIAAAGAIALLASAAHAAGTQTDTTRTQMQAPATTTKAAGELTFFQSVPGNAHLASQLIGQPVYDNQADGANEIGKIKDLVIAENGSIEAVIIGVGGFLGVGEKDVAVGFETVAMMPAADGQANQRLVLITTADQLKSAPEFEIAVVQNAPAGTSSQQQADQTAMAPEPEQGGQATQPVQPAPDANQLASSQPEGNAQPAPEAGQVASGQPAGNLSDVDVTTVSANDLVNTTVYSADNQNVGEVGDVILKADGTIDAIVIDVGGFLGIGEKPVAIGFEGLTIRRDQSNNLYVYTSFTKDQLDAAPTYDKDQYLQNPDAMRLRTAG